MDSRDGRDGKQPSEAEKAPEQSQGAVAGPVMAGGPTDDIEEGEWDKIGFHRPLGGMLFNFVLVIGVAVFAALFMFYLLPNFILPFPEAIGYQDIIKNLFAVYFMLADVGVGRAIQRYVADENIKNPKKAIAYLQFFNWFQMFTGLGQVTFISVWAIGFVVRTDLAYAAWFIMVYCTIQYPGMLGIFHGTLSSFQRYDKANLISFLQAVVLETATRMSMVIVGRLVGLAVPAIGEVMGATIGSIIGAYIDDFIAAIIAAWWTRPLLKKINPEWGIKNMFFVEFDRALVKECLWFGIKAILPSTFHQVSQFIQTMLLIAYLPNYGTIWGLFTLAETVSGVVGTFKFSMSAPASEAYNNGKVILVQDYQARSYRWLGITQPMLGVTIFMAAPLLGLIAGPQFMMAAPMIQVLVIGRIAEAPGAVNADLFMGCDKPEYYIYTNALEAISRISMLFLLLVPFNLGWVALAIARIAGWWFRMISGFFLVGRLFKLKIAWWQTVIAPAGAAVVVGAIAWAYLAFVYPPFEALVGMVPAALVSIGLALAIIPMFIFFPVHVLLGGWDDTSIALLKRALNISGPSKPFITVLYKITVACSKITPLHGRFALDYTDVQREIDELMEMKRASREGV